MDKPMWLRYNVVLQVAGPFAASLPRTPEEIKTMLENRMPAKAPPDYIPIDELAEEIVEAVSTDEEAPKPGWATFCRDETGLYYEGRCVRGHIKDCALQVASFFQPATKNFRAKFVNRVYVITNKIYMDKNAVDGTQELFIQVMTRRGPRSSIKNVDYVNDPKLTFEMKVLNDGVITEEHLRAVFEYGGIHGMGQERSQGWGRYALVSITQIIDAPKVEKPKRTRTKKAPKAPAETVEAR